MSKYEIKELDNTKRLDKNKVKKQFRVYLKKENELMTMDDVEYIYEKFSELFPDADISQIMGRNSYHMTSLIENGYLTNYDDEYYQIKSLDGYDLDKYNKFYYIDLNLILPIPLNQEPPN
jgi:hypothetical protein